MKTVEERFWEKVERPADPSDTCLLWTACCSKYGYGSFKAGGKMVSAHRWSYEYHVGKIPDGLVIDHLCRVRNCVNPDHLEVVTNRENVLRGLGVSAVNARKVKCNQGHSFNDKNTYVNPNTGERKCRTCERRWHRSK